MVPRDKPEGDGKRGLAGVLLAALLAACATTPEIGWQARHAAAEALREAVRFSETPLPDAWVDVPVTTMPVPINDPDLEAGTGGVIYVGGFQITSEFNRLHGLSDIKFQDQSRFVAVTDEGLLVRGALALDAGGRPTGLNDVAVRPLTDPDGQALVPKYLADAEGLAILPNGELLVSFERLHRVWRYDREGRWLGERVIPDFAFTENEGMEGIGATVHADQFWAAGEDGGLWWCFTVRCGVFISPPAVTPTDDDLRTTSLVTLDGTIYRLERAYHAARNTNTIQISELELVEGAAEPSLAWRTLATFTAPATVDNFEGIAAVRRPDGGVRLYILSDDNFNPGQRTLLLAFDVRWLIPLPEGEGGARLRSSWEGE
jgi:hypothetical protein